MLLGDGRLGLLCAQVMSQLNATVRLVGKHPEKLALCEKWGVKHRLLEDVGASSSGALLAAWRGAPGRAPGHSNNSTQGDHTHGNRCCKILKSRHYHQRVDPNNFFLSQ